MKDILQEIIAAKRIAVEQLKRTADRSALERKIDENRSHRSMREALAASTSGIIAEFKRRSPSKGWINREADVRTVASDYQANGAAALSILTDTPYFGGSAEDLIAARRSTFRFCVRILRSTNFSFTRAGRSGPTRYC